MNQVRTFLFSLSLLLSTLAPITAEIKSQRSATTVYITLQDVPGALKGEALRGFENVCANFLTSFIQDVDDFTCSVMDQILLDNSAVSGPVQLEVLVPGRMDDFVPDYVYRVLSSFQEETDLFISLLQEESDFFDSLFRSKVESSPTVTRRSTNILGYDRNLVIGVAAGIWLFLLMTVMIICSFGGGTESVELPRPIPQAAEKQKASMVTSDTSTIGDSTAGSSSSLFESGMVCRKISAPPGKLGVVIDTTMDGPMVFSVREDSPLRGSIFPGDFVLSINKVSTRTLSSSQMLALMASTAQRGHRELVVLGKSSVADAEDNELF